MWDEQWWCTKDSVRAQPKTRPSSQGLGRFGGWMDVLEAVGVSEVLESEVRGAAG